MTTENVQPTQTADQPDHFAEIAAALYRIADDIVTLTGSGLPKPNVSLSIQPGVRNDDERTVRAVDAVSSALLGHPGQVQLMSGGVYHYNNGESAERVGPVEVRVLYSISTEFAVKRHATELLDRREAELERLRAEVAELRKRVLFTRQDGTQVDVTEEPGEDPTGMSYTRADTEPDDPTPVSPGRVPLHTGSVVRDSELVIDQVLAGSSLAPAPIAGHYEARGWTGEGPGSSGVECACTVGFGGCDSLAEASELLARHIAAANAGNAAPQCLPECEDVSQLTGPARRHHRDGCPVLAAYAELGDE